MYGCLNECFSARCNVKNFDELRRGMYLRFMSGVQTIEYIIFFFGFIWQNHYRFRVSPAWLHRCPTGGATYKRLIDTRLSILFSVVLSYVSWYECSRNFPVTCSYEFSRHAVITFASKAQLTGLGGPIPQLYAYM